jgi:hypothetical protein
VIEQWWKNTEKILLFYSNLYKVVKAWTMMIHKTEWIRTKNMTDLISDAGDTHLQNDKKKKICSWWTMRGNYYSCITFQALA